MTCRTAKSGPEPALIADIGGTNVRFGLAYADGRIDHVEIGRASCRERV